MCPYKSLTLTHIHIHTHTHKSMTKRPETNDTIFPLLICKKRVHILLYIQQDAMLHSLFISGNCSTYFEWYLHPSSGAHTSTAFGICHTITATCRYLGRDGTKIAEGSNYGVTNTKCCRCMCSWWWVEVPPETCRALSRYK